MGHCCGFTIIAVYALFAAPQICGTDAAWVAYTSNSGVQKCYYFANSPVLSWHSANLECQNYGGNLLTIASLDEQIFITGRVSDK